MSAQLSAQQLAQILKSAQEKGLDLSNAEAIQAFASELTAKPVKAPRAKKEVTDPSTLCIARVWGSGSGLDRCQKTHKDNEEFCAAHLKQWKQGQQPCCHDENGQKFGLFCGRIDQPIPYKNSLGQIVIRWTSEEMKSLIAIDEKSGIKSAPFTKEGHKENGTKHIPVIKRIRKPKAASEQAPVPAKASKGKGKSKKDPNAPKKATNAYMFFTNEKRAEVKAKLLADFLALNPDADQKAQTAATAVGKVAQAIGALWKDMADEAKAPFKQLEEADKVRFDIEMTAYKAQKALGLGSIQEVFKATQQEYEEELEQEDAEDEEEEEPKQQEEGLECEEVEIDGETYLVDAQQNVYDTDCNPLGKLVDGKIVA